MTMALTRDFRQTVVERVHRDPKFARAKSLHRMLSRSGNPSMDNLAAIFDAIRQQLKVGLKAQTVKAA